MFGAALIGAAIAVEVLVIGSGGISRLDPDLSRGDEFSFQCFGLLTIIGSVIGGVVSICIASIALRWRLRRKNRKSAEDGDSSRDEQTGS